MSTNQSTSSFSHSGSTTTDGSDTTDDEESTNTSGSVTPTEQRCSAFPSRSSILEAFYLEWKHEVDSRHRENTCVLASIEQNSNKQTPVFVDQQSNQRLPLVYCQDSNSLDIGTSETEVMKFPHSYVIQPEIETYGRTHISVLPYELICRIFRWAIGSHLDIRILGRLSLVCRAFYIIAHDPHVWRAICFRLWTWLKSHSEVWTTPNSIPPPQLGYYSWRQMAIHKPHLLMDGCYLCRITYVRPGEQIFGCHYRRMHLVVYYRGIRFHSDGRMIMLTSTLAPNAVVAALNQHSHQECQSAASDPSHSSAKQADMGVGGGYSGEGFLLGTYTWCEPNIVVCTLKRPKVREKPQPFRRLHPRTINSDVETTYDIRFVVASSKRRLHSVLNWESYFLRSTNTSTQVESVTRLNLDSDHFPPCYFSPVRSYLRTVASEPL